MQCKYLKKKLNNKLECKLDKNKKIPNDCANCNFKTWKYTELKRNCANYHFPDNRKPIKQRSNKLASLERKRFSLFTNDLTKCIICGKSPINKHEIFGGKNRLRSIEFGLVIPLCTCEHHNQIECKGIHFNKQLQKEWKTKGQVIFETTYPDLNFIDIFGKSYK